MGEILAFRARQAPETFRLRGPARCMHCQHEWEAVSPEGVIDCLECPACRLPTGVRKGMCEPEKGVRWVCTCGCDLFYILVHGCQCLMCGLLAKGF